MGESTVAFESRTGAPGQPTVEDALWSLYDLAGQVTDPTGQAQFQRLPLERALSILSDASPEEVTVTSRRAALAALAHANGDQLPRYAELRDVYDRYVLQLVPEPPLQRSDAAMRSQIQQLIQDELYSWFRDACEVH